MVVTDLHGAWDAYVRYRDRFLHMLEQGGVDRLILCGDLIHSEGPAHSDRSLDMVLDVIRLQERYGAERVVMLLGNHELPHLYSMPLSRGAVDYTPRFERALVAAGEEVRARVLAFFDGLPFFVRTAAGVMLSHAGASPVAALPRNRQRLATFCHQELIRQVDAHLAGRDAEELRQTYNWMTGADYDEDVRYYLGISDSEHPRYGDLMRLLVLNRSDVDFNLLWETFFTRNERDVGEDMYHEVLARFLQVWSEGAPAPQQVLLTGHIAVLGGHQIVAERQLRLASWAHAHPHEAGVYLLLDCAAPVHAPDDLIDHVGSVLRP